METTGETINRFIICQWAYGWSNYKTYQAIQEYFSHKAFERHVVRERETEALILEIKRQQEIPVYSIPKENKNRCYGGKYIKRRYR